MKKVTLEMIGLIAVVMAVAALWRFIFSVDVAFGIVATFSAVVMGLIVPVLPTMEDDAEEVVVIVVFKEES